MPDLTADKTIEMLNRWEGEWSYLPNLSFVKIAATGDPKPSTFPPQHA